LVHHRAPCSKRVPRLTSIFFFLLFVALVCWCAVNETSSVVSWCSTMASWHTTRPRRYGTVCAVSICLLFLLGCCCGPRVGLSIALWGLDCLLLVCLLLAPGPRIRLAVGPHVRARCDFGVQSWDIGKPPQKGLFIPVMFYQLSPSVCHYHLPRPCLLVLLMRCYGGLMGPARPALGFFCLPSRILLLFT
jgi:hypothetical protein